MKKLLIILLLLSTNIWAQDKLTEKDKLRFDTAFFDAMNERLKNNYAKSNEYFEQCLSIDDQNDAVYFKMAQNYFDLKDYTQAEVYLEKAQKINPSNKWYEKLHIEIKINNGAPETEIKKMIEAFKQMAQNKYIIKNLYRKLRQKRNRPIAVSTDIKQVVNPVDWNKLLLEKKYKKLLEKAETELEKQPDKPLLYLYAAQALTGLHHYADALDYLDMGWDFVQKNKNMQKAYYQQYIIIYEALQKPEKVKSYRQKLQKI